MRICVLQHAPAEGLGSIQAWLDANGITTITVHAYDGQALPPDDAYGGVIALGGPMSVNDEHPWLTDEKRLVRRAIDAGKPLLGICLGSQLVASALGARVLRAPHPEIGWFPVYGSQAPGFSLAPELLAFHWHSDMFELPEQAVHLAKSDACPNQAFRYRDKVIALQYHPEATPELVEAMITAGEDELASGQRYIQQAVSLRTHMPAALPKLEAELHRILGDLF